MESNLDKVYLLFDKGAESMQEQMAQQGYKLGTQKDYQRIYYAIAYLFTQNMLTPQDKNIVLRRLLRDMYADSERL